MQLHFKSDLEDEVCPSDTFYVFTKVDKKVGYLVAALFRSRISFHEIIYK